MRIIEHFKRGKHDDERCEDAIGFTGSHVVIADGATARTPDLFAGKTPGWIIAQSVVDAVMRTQDPTLSGKDLIRYINSHLRDVVIPGWGLPTNGPSIGSASLAVYCAAKHELTAVCDI